MNKFLIFLLMLLMPVFAFASVPEWKIIPSESSITFTGTQNGAPTSGSFKKFSGDIKLDKNDLKDSQVRLVIDMSSVAMSFSDFTATLLTADWFDVKRFPDAVFTANQFTKITNNQYQANGTLTIRDKTQPIMITFTTEELFNNKGRVKGSVTLKRTVFGIGQGEWADTDAVKDDVVVNFVITADRQK